MFVSCSRVGDFTLRIIYWRVGNLPDLSHKLLRTVLGWRLLRGFSGVLVGLKSQNYYYFYLPFDFSEICDNVPNCFWMVIQLGWNQNIKRSPFFISDNLVIFIYYSYLRFPKIIFRILGFFLVNNLHTCPLPPSKGVDKICLAYIYSDDFKTKKNVQRIIFFMKKIWKLKKNILL